MLPFVPQIRSTNGPGRDRYPTHREVGALPSPHSLEQDTRGTPFNIYHKAHVPREHDANVKYVTRAQTSLKHAALALTVVHMLHGVRITILVRASRRLAFGVFFCEST